MLTDLQLSLNFLPLVPRSNRKDVFNGPGRNRRRIWQEITEITPQTQQSNPFKEKLNQNQPYRRQ